MRKEVKLGMAIGGGLIAVLVVYLLVAPPTNNKKGTQLAGAGPNGSIIEGGAPGDVMPAGDDKAAGKAGNDGAAGQAPTAGAGDAPQTQGQGTQGAPADQGTGKPKDWSILQTGKTDKAAGGQATPPTASGAGKIAAKVEKRDVIVEGRGSPAPVAEQPRLYFNPNDAWGGGVSTDAPVLGSARLGGKGALTTGAAPTTRPAAGGGKHVVQSGETFSSIALATYGSAAYYPHLLRANPNVNPNNLKLGTVITLPHVDEVKAAAVPGEHTGGAASVTDVKIDNTKQYRVESGDSLYKISLKLYGKSTYVERIYEKNKAAIGADPKKLKLGMVLELPEKVTSAAATPAETTTSTLGDGGPGNDNQPK